MLHEFVRVATASELVDNQMVLRLVAAGGILEQLLVVRIDDEYFVVDDRCTHAFGSLHDGRLHSDSFEVECPIHAGMFDLRTGAVTQAPPEEAITTYAVRVDGQDVYAGPAE